MLADLIVVVLLAGLLAWSHRGAFISWLRATTFPVAELRASSLTLVLGVCLVMSALGWAQSVASLGLDSVANVVLRDIPPFEERRCFNAQRFAAVQLELVDPPGPLHCPAGGGPFEVNGPQVSCAVHGKAPP